MKNLNVYGYGGDALTAPENTETAYWAALGGGGSGFVAPLQISTDGTVYCSEENYNAPWSEISKLSAGDAFKSTALNADGTAKSHGEDNPWGRAKKNDQWDFRYRPLKVPRLDEMLITFGRRTTVFLRLPLESQQELIDATLAVLKKVGLRNRVTLVGDKEAIESIRSEVPTAQCVLIGQNVNDLSVAANIGAKSLILDWSVACSDSKLEPNLKAQLEKGKVSLILSSPSTVFHPSEENVNAVQGVIGVEGIFAKGVLPTVERVTPPALIAEDSFDGTDVNTDLWAFGYSHINEDTTISQNDGLHIDIKPDGVYSGAAGVCLTTIHGRFDAQVRTSVSNQQQGTTYEMAAICIDPGYHHPDNTDLNTRNVHLGFDVHGAAPYASSERDEDDGFRCGWNNGFNLTKIADDWVAASANMYNKYGRNVGPGTFKDDTGRLYRKDPDSMLRLVRNGQIFVSYYKDKFNEGWVCSGTMLVQNMAEDVYLRLAGKHWEKYGKKAPANNFSFYDFKLYQF